MLIRSDSGRWEIEITGTSLYLQTPKRSSFMRREHSLPRRYFDKWQEGPATRLHVLGWDVTTGRTDQPTAAIEA